MNCNLGQQRSILSGESLKKKNTVEFSFLLIPFVTCPIHYRLSFILATVSFIVYIYIYIDCSRCIYKLYFEFHNPKFPCRYLKKKILPSAENSILTFNILSILFSPLSWQVWNSKSEHSALVWFLCHVVHSMEDMTIANLMKVHTLN